MSIETRIRKYAEEHFGGVMHTTLNPEGPGVVRIHLIPPKYEGGELAGSVAIINGQDVIPVNVSWSILLSEFIDEVNKYHGREVSKEEVDSIVDLTVKRVRKIFPLLSKKIIREDILTIMVTFMQIAYGKEVDQDIEIISLGDYAPMMKAPHRMDLMVSAMTKDGFWHCNQQCVHCYAAGQVHADEKELSTEEWKKILDHLREVGVPQVTFTGGEPTMREDLVELIDHARWFVTRLNTNGIKLTADYCRQLKDASLDSMQITFYSCDKEIHNKLVGADRFDAVVSGIDTALKLGMNISVNTPLCKDNRDYAKTLSFLEGMGVKYVTCSGLITTGNAGTGVSETQQLSVDEIRDILRDAAEFAYSHGMEISFTSPGWIDQDFCSEIGIAMPSCGACLSNMAITPSGNVVPCQSWLSDEPLGNILTDEWKTIWESEACRKHRDYSAKMTGKCPLRRKEGADE